MINEILSFFKNILGILAALLTIFSIIVTLIVIPKLKRSKKIKKLLYKLFEPISENLYFDMGEGHQYAKKYRSPLHTYAFKAILKGMYGFSKKRKKWKQIMYGIKLGYVDLERHICSIGGPMSNQLVQKAMGYSLTNLEETPKTNLPMIFNLKRRNLGWVTRFDKGRPVEISNWSVIDTTTGKEFVPEVDEEHLLRTDYLLITFMPNNFSNKKNKIHMIFASCHAPGIAAVKNLTKDLDTLQEIKKNRKDSQYFQSLIKIIEVKYSRKKLCMPVKLQHIKTIPLLNEILLEKT